MPTVRAYGTPVYVTSNTANVPLPAGASAGDSLYLLAEHGWAANAIIGWDFVDNSPGSFVNGATFTKILNAADITAGSVTASFINSYFGVIQAVCMIGATDVRASGFFRNSSGAATRALTTSASLTTGDVVIWFGSGRANMTVTFNRGALQQTTSNFEASGATYDETLASGGSVTGTFSFSATPSGDYGGYLDLADVPPGFQITKAETGPWLEPGDGFSTSRVEVGPWLEPGSGFATSRVEVGPWLEPGVGFTTSRVEVGAWLEPGTLPSGDDAGFCSIIWGQ